MPNFRTPLRYPGGKQRLTPFIKDILFENNINGHYVEPYAGGAGVGIELLLSRKIKNIHLNDLHKGIYAFWYSVINHTEELCRRITSASLTIEEWKKRRDIIKNCDQNDLLELGFSTFYLNRCNRSGVLSGGVIGGLDQTGNYKMDARFNRVDLIQRIEAIALFKNQIKLTNTDAESYIINYIPKLPLNTLIYLDPPYYNKAKELYINSYKKEDHINLAQVIQNQIQHKWILSYDGVGEILDLYKQRRFFIYNLQYSAAKVYKGEEVFVFCDNLVLPHTSSLKHVQIGLDNLING